MDSDRAGQKSAGSVRYRVVFRPAALRDLADLPREVERRIVAALDALANDPRPLGTEPLTGDLKGLRKLRLGTYRAAYEIDDAAQCVRVWGLGHRRGFYDRIRRRV